LTFLTNYVNSVSHLHLHIALGGQACITAKHSALGVITGSFIVEKIYSILGLGYWFVTSVLNCDYPLIMGITVFYCALLLAAYLVDVACLLIDPLLREPAKAKKGVV